ncbi:hypothetical protein F511_43966 [Dorcoceras hygrometricum]|uniref:Uncharacterized protein n=1 Tax=Dorcoceras hygrometricum TaxID=472368 RepID=A0A2Z6ZYA4_9LAMI|nr:hypothetical protein F511_43966 [Dorcoceras hygrometricum]
MIDSNRERTHFHRHKSVDSINLPNQQVPTNQQTQEPTADSPTMLKQIAKQTNGWFSKRRRTNLFKRRRIECYTSSWSSSRKNKTMQRFSLLVPVTTSKRSVTTNSNDVAPPTSSNLIAVLAKYQQQATVKNKSLAAGQSVVTSKRRRFLSSYRNVDPR